MTDADARRAERGTVFAHEDGHLLGVGDVTYRFRNSDLAIVEDKLLELGEVETMVEQPGEGRPTTVKLQGWDAIEVWAQLRPFRLVPILIYAGLRHGGFTVEELDEAVPPEALTDPKTVDPILRALAKAMGRDPDEKPTPPNRAARRSSSSSKKAAGSTGGSSSTAGRPRSRSAASTSQRRRSPKPPQD